MATQSLYVGLLALATPLPLAQALGCYSGGLDFDYLHGGDYYNQPGLDIDTEVAAAINTVCSSLEGTKWEKGGLPYTRCSNWTVTVEPDTTFCCNVIDGGCIPDCGGPELDSVNRINWEIQYKGDEDEVTFDSGKCVEWFNTEYGGCDTGSEQESDDFWYKIDPNVGECPPGDPAPEESVPTSQSSTVLPTSTPAPTEPPTATAAARNPQATTNEFQYNGYSDSEADIAERDQIHEAFDTYWADMLDAGMNALADTSDDTFDRWFPSKAGGTDARAYVRRIFDKIYNHGQNAPQTQVQVLTNEKEDFLGDCEKNIATVNAYFEHASGRFHICPAGLGMPITPDENECDELGLTVTEGMRSLTLVQVHEFLHWDKVGLQLKAPSVGGTPPANSCIKADMGS